LEISGYEDLEEIGRGGYAVVYRAHQAAFGRQVAIKVLTNPGLTDLDRSRFEREGLAMGQLSWHPNIVVVHDTGRTDGDLPYLVMEYLEGGSLGDRLRTGGALSPVDAVDHIVRLSAAVHTAHEAGLLHRDVKPDNALLDAFGRVKLADFGIAAITGSTLTATGMVTATVAHAAPEVLTGERASPAADVYSLGSTLFELLAGTSAFARDTDESLVPHVLRATRDPVPDLRTRGVPDPIAAVVEWSMAKAPGDRPATALEFGRALQKAQAALGMPVTNLEVRGAEPPPRPEEETVSRTPPPPPAGTTSEEPAAAELAAPTGTVNVPRVITPPPGPALVGPGPPPPERRSRLPVVLGGLLVIAVAVGLYVMMSGGDDSSGGGGGDDTTTTEGGDPTIAVVPVGDRPFRIAATGDAVWVTNDEGNSVSHIDPATNEVLDTFDVGGEPVGVAATADAVWVAVYDQDTLLRLDPTTGEVVAPITVGDGPRNVLTTATDVWVPNYNANTVSRIDAQTNQVTFNVPVGAGPRGVATSSDGAIWVTNSEEGTVSRIDPATNMVTDTTPVGGFPSGIVTTSGGVWVTNSDNETVIHLDPTTAEVVGTTPVGEDPGGMASSEDAVWVANAAVNTVSQIDPATGEVVDVIDVGTAPGGLAVTGTDLWVANTEDDTVSRIDTG
jgi:YVTN family beta-propeller protein